VVVRSLLIPPPIKFMYISLDSLICDIKKKKKREERNNSTCLNKARVAELILSPHDHLKDGSISMVMRRKNKKK
jgi:hypothetical protein